MNPDPTPPHSGQSEGIQDYTSGYQSYFRVLDHRGVLHLATESMHPSQALCAEPPYPNHWDDPAPRVFPPGALTSAYRHVCPVCEFARRPA